MKFAILIARILLGAVFVLFGANSIVHFLPMTPPPGDAGLYLSLLATHKYSAVVGLLQVVGGLLLLVGRFVPLGLTILGPILVNVVLFHTLFNAPGLPLGVVLLLLEAFLIFAYRQAFSGLFSAGPEVLGSPKL